MASLNQSTLVAKRVTGLTSVLSFCGLTSFAMQANANFDADNFARLKQLSLDELLAVEVMSVSKRPEKLTEAASAIQIISQEDIRRSAAISIPQALRLAPNLQVAQVNSSQWAISSRGFDNVLANKLLVLIDGRTVYTPLYAGVFWDAQDTLLEDVDRIEVISGPGGTLWGANAVNGVINITTKNAQDTQGLYIEGSAGDELRGMGGIRYGGQVGSIGYYRAYAKTASLDDTLLLNGREARDAWHRKQGGFRFDFAFKEDIFTVQSDVYAAKPNPDGTVPVDSSGGNLLSRWRHAAAEDSDFQLQLYYDWTKRNFSNGFIERLRTYDLDWQHRFRPTAAQEIVWGLGLRWMDHEVGNLPLFAFMPAQKTLRLYSAFAQDELRFAADSIRLTLGSKFEHNDYTGFEIQPNVRLAWLPTERQTLWTSASRAVRTPARIDRDFYLSSSPTLRVIAGADFDSEEVIAYEAGWRIQPQSDLTLSLSTFFNDYDNMRTAEPGPPPFGLPITFANGLEGQTYGAELGTIYNASATWRVRGGYTFLKKHLFVKPTSRDLNRGSAESDDPEHQVVLHSELTLPYRWEINTVARFVDRLPSPRVASHLDVDLQIVWTTVDNLQLAMVGQNLLDNRHGEFIPSSPSPRAIERSFYGKISWRY